MGTALCLCRLGYNTGPQIFGAQTFITLAQIRIQKKHSLPSPHASHPTDYAQIKDKDSNFVARIPQHLILSEQKLSSWIYFAAILGVVIFVLNAACITNSTGFGEAFVDAVSVLSDSRDRIEAKAYCIKVWYNHFYSFYYNFYFWSLYLFSLLWALLYF